MASNSWNSGLWDTALWDALDGVVLASEAPWTPRWYQRRGTMAGDAGGERGQGYGADIQCVRGRQAQRLLAR